MTSRRHFLAAAAAPLFAQTRSANDQIQVAIIGHGIQGIGDLRASVTAGAKLVAAADVYQGRLTRTQEIYGKDIFISRDYRDVLARRDVDAVIIAVPDHWHRTMAIDAMNAGKDVYVEKPMVQRIDDGKPVMEAEKKTGRILQVGSQRVSSIVYQKAQELLKGGAIGQLNMVEAWVDRNSAIGAWQYSIPPDATPENIDWDRFLGRAPKVPFEPVRLFRWRNYQDYGTGVAGDLFVHLFTGIHFVTGSIGPTRVYTSGGLRFWKDGRDVPDIMLGLYDYPATAAHPAFTLSLRVNFVDGGTENSGFRFIGSEGMMTIANGVTVAKMPRETEPGQTADTFAKAMQDEYLRQYAEKYPKPRPTADGMRPQADDHYLPPRGYSDHLEHHRNFLTAVRTRKAVIEDSVFGFRAAGPALLSNVSYFEKRVCNWDPEKFVAS
jgi:predicted dehydrogenase